MGKFKKIYSDLTVIGGGIAGICSSVAAARAGLRVALINDRPMLGGNASSEIRVWLNGAAGPPTDHPSAGRNLRYSREGGIVEEIVLKNKFLNPDGNAHLWDMILLDLVRAEQNINLYLNTLITDVDMDDKRLIGGVTGYQTMSERCFKFKSPYFVDASGDGVVAYKAGAEFRVGSEAKDVYDEDMAPSLANSGTMGSTIMFATQKAEYPVKFFRPEFAYDFKKDPPRILEKRANPSDSRSCWWWIEWGGQLDTIGDNEEIRDELLRIVYGVWDYLKNSGRFPETKNHQLEWVGSIPGKRESRRFIGPYVITEHDLTNQTEFPDTVAHGGWPIDLHPAEGFYEKEGKGSTHRWLNGPYEIPYRILISKDLDNLWLAGRIASASRVAFGSIRVQKTLGALGQAIGSAAAIAHRHDLKVRDVVDFHTEVLQQQLLRDDQWIIGVKNNDPDDLAQRARVRASSCRELSAEGNTWLPLDRDLAITFPEAEDFQTLVFQMRAENPLSLEIDQWTPKKRQNLIPEEPYTRSVHPLRKGKQKVVVNVERNEKGVGYRGLTLMAAPGASLLVTDEILTGVTIAEDMGEQDGEFWRLVNFIPAFTADCRSPYPAENIINGYSRPYGGPNSWVSKPLAANPEWVELEWDKPQDMNLVQLTFNSNLNTNLLNLTRTESPVIPQLVRDYRILTWENGVWRKIVEVKNNYLRVRRHDLGGVRASRLKVEILATNGAPSAEIFEIRVY